MTKYDELLDVAEQEGIRVLEYDFEGQTRGLYCDNYIVLNKNLSSNEKYCTLAEEMGHYYTASSNILDLKSINNRKQELLGRRWGYKSIVPLPNIVDAVLSGCDNIAEVADYLEVTPEYLQEALCFYHQKYGTHTYYKNYMLIFDDNTIRISKII